MYVYPAMLAWFPGATEVVVDGTCVERDVEVGEKGNGGKVVGVIVVAVEVSRNVRVREPLPKSGEELPDDTIALSSDEKAVPGCFGVVEACVNDVLISVPISVSVPGPASKDNPLVVVIDVAFPMLSDVQVALPEVPPRVVE